ncbi:MAG TPA: HDOD domain-containing protein [Gammaproteobacteria bacterium]
MSEIFVGRQPIYNRELEVYAYELMARAGHSDDSEASIKDADKATSQVIINAFLEIGIDKLVNKHIAFIKLAEHFLRQDYELPLPADRVILKIPGYVKVDEEVIAGAKRLTSKGFRLAIDNYLIHTRLQPLASMACMIDMNIEAVKPDELQAHIKILKKLHPILLADHVRSYDDYEFCRDLGMDYFQGYFLSRPKIISGESLTANKMTIMSLLANLHNPEADTDSIETIITRDVSLSYKILKLINSAFFARPTKIESIKHAVVMLGRRQLCTWASMMALTGMDDKPREQVRLAMTRAKTCELLAQKAGLTPLDSFFTIGMFSALDLLMDRSLEELIAPLPLADNIIAALLNREGDLGDALNCALAQETADWLNIQFAGLSDSDLSDANIEAINWAEEVLNII